MRFWRIDLPAGLGGGFVAGVEESGGIVRRAPPILRWAIRKPWPKLERWAKRKGATVELLRSEPRAGSD